MRLGSSGAAVVARVGKRNHEWWMRNVLGTRPWAAQVRMAESIRRHAYTAIASCNSAGKTTGMAHSVAWFSTNHPRSASLITAPTARQVKFGLFKELRVAHRNARIPLGGQPITQQWNLPSKARGGEAGPVRGGPHGRSGRSRGVGDWYVLGFTTSDYNHDALAGIHAEEMVVVVDEAGGIPTSQFEAIDGLVASGNSRVVLIGNPLLVGTDFHRAFSSPSVNSWRISAFDTPNFTSFGIGAEDIESGEWQEKQGGAPLPYPGLIRPSWVRMMWEKWGPSHPFFLARVLALFPDNRPDALITERLLAIGWGLDLPDERADVVLGVDVARGGRDQSCIYKKRGRMLRHVQTMHVPDLMTVTGYVVRAAREHGAKRIYIDMDGLGAGVHDRLRELNLSGVTVTGVNFGSRAWHPDDFANKKAEMYWAVRDRLERQELDIDPRDDEWARQAREVKWGASSSGKMRIKIESKDETKARLEGDSPDEFDAGALTMCGDIEPAFAAR